MEDLVSMFDNVYKNKKIILTGHTGFKGTWMTLWLKHLGAEVYGISKDIPTEPSLYTDARIHSQNHRINLDVKNFTDLKTRFEEINPDFVFHFAAQAIVSKSYTDPLETIGTNVLGTANILQIIKNLDPIPTTVLITSDKCYENVEQEWGYRECDRIGGKDIYSASKGCAELIFHGFYNSFFKDKDVAIATARAGNVIGGGDWAIDRIIPDAFRAWSKNQCLDIRSPASTRPWQHVLEPLSGYLTLGSALYSGKLKGECSFNFGPSSEDDFSVGDLINNVAGKIKSVDAKSLVRIHGQIKFHEAKLLKLNCEMAFKNLKWKACLSFDENCEFIASWFDAYQDKTIDISEFTMEQIKQYETFARKKGISWCE